MSLKNHDWGATFATALLFIPTLALAGFTGEAVAKMAHEARVAPRCYLVAHQSMGKPMVSPDSALANSTICVAGEPGTRQVVDAIQGHLRANALASKNPAPVVILNIMLAEDKSNGKRNRT